jgi:glycosyltransferase involved in cell wall biosynthesis
MRVGLIIYGELETRTGGFLYDRMLVKHLQEMGDHVELLSLPWRGYLGKLSQNYSSTLIQRIADLNLDVLLEDELNHPSLFLLNQRIRKVYDGPILAIVHHLLSSEFGQGKKFLPLLGAIEKRYLQSVDGFVFNSHSTKKTVEAVIGNQKPGLVASPSASHIQVPPNRSPREWKKPPMRLLYVGSLIPRKGLHTLIKAVHQLRQKDWELTVIGNMQSDQKYAQQIRAMIQRFDLTQNITLRGSLNDQALIKAYKEHDLFVMPSYYEGFGIAYLEAMGFGLPVIATTGGGSGEIVRHDQNGLLLEPDHPGILAHAIQMLIENPQHMKRMSLGAIQTFNHHPSWLQSAAKIRNYFSIFHPQSLTTERDPALAA